MWLWDSQPLSPCFFLLTHQSGTIPIPVGWFQGLAHSRPPTNGFREPGKPLASVFIFCLQPPNPQPILCHHQLYLWVLASLPGRWLWLLASGGFPVWRTPGRPKCMEKMWIVIRGVLFFFNLAMPHGMWDLSSPARDWTCGSCIGSTEPLGRQGSPRVGLSLKRTLNTFQIMVMLLSILPQLQSLLQARLIFLKCWPDLMFLLTAVL